MIEDSMVSKDTFAQLYQKRRAMWGKECSHAGALTPMTIETSDHTPKFVDVCMKCGRAPKEDETMASHKGEYPIVDADLPDADRGEITFGWGNNALKFENDGTIIFNERVLGTDKEILEGFRMFLAEVKSGQGV